MIFSSWQFILFFLPITFVIYFGLNQKARLSTTAKIWLVTSSLFFYGYWNIYYLPLIFSSILFNFAVSRALSPAYSSHTPATNKKTILTIGITVNLALLAYYKYSEFIVQNINLAFNVDNDTPSIVLPLAISFFTFQQISYLVDSHHNKTREYNFLNYTLFVTFFPQLIAGPIVHHNDIIPQFTSRWNLALRYRNIIQGLFIFGIGFFKKIAIADTFAKWANAGFDGSNNLDFYAAWATSLSYTFQIYFDFSGYCDMAIGAALLFNIKLPLNFNSPYKASNIQDFWRRWHITLSRFLRDYLYIPLGGNRTSTGRVYLNILVTFILGGLWHGASWMFVIWGALHGIAVVTHRMWRTLNRPFPTAIAWFITFLFVNISWIFFRAKNWEDAERVLKGMADFGSALGLSNTLIPTSALAWGGTLSDIFLQLLPNGLVPYMTNYALIIFAFIIIWQKNAFELMIEKIGFAKLTTSAIAFSLAMYLTLFSKSTIFLYYNF